MTDETVAQDSRETGTERGRTVVDEKVRRKLAEHAVESVPGTVEHRGLAGIAGKPLPSVKFDDHDPREVQVQVAAKWPVDTDKLVNAVRSSVNNELQHSLGEEPSAVHVHVARINGDSDERANTFLTSAQAQVDQPDSKGKNKLAPRRVAGSSIAAVLVLIALLVLGIIALRDTVVRWGWAGGQPWLDQVAQYADDFRWDWWVWPAAIGAAIIGLVFLVWAVAPRRKSHTAVSNELWLSRNLIKHSRKGQS